MDAKSAVQYDVRNYSYSGLAFAPAGVSEYANDTKECVYKAQRSYKIASLDNVQITIEHSKRPYSPLT